MLELGMVHVQELDAFSYVLGFVDTPEVLVFNQYGGSISTLETKPVLSA